MCMCRLATLWILLACMAPKRREPSVPLQEIARRASLETHVTQSAAARLLKPKGKGLGKGGSLRQARRRFADLVQKPSLESTPYGDVVKKFEVVTDSGPVQLDYVCPHAWLYFACLQCQTFAQFLIRYLSQGLPGQGSICIYSDDVTPGNVLRPDTGRTFMAVYWGVMEMPDFFRSRGLLWQTLMYVPMSLLHSIRGGLSALYVKILECFWEGELDMQRLGIRLLVGEATVHIHMQFACFLSDEKAEKEALGVKGASGTKMCISCQNCVRVDEESLPEDSPMVHYSCTDMTRFIPHTVESLQELLEGLRAGQAGMSNAEFKFAEQSVGINYADAVLLQSHMKGIANVPLSRYVDWFHNLVASGGVLQYQFNQLLFELNRLGISPASVDEFVYILPKSHTKLKSTFFNDRFVKHPRKHLRAFGSEMFSAASKLALFMAVVVDPIPALPQHSALLRLARRMLELLLLGDRVLGLLNELDTTIKEHHVLYKQLLPQCMKPKVHYNRHLPEHMRRYQVNISCLPAERKHKMPKQRAAHCFRRFHKTLLTQEVYAMTQALKDDSAYQKDRLGTPEAPVAASDIGWQVLAGSGMCPPLVKATYAQCGNNHLHSKDMLLCKGGQQHLVGSADCFIRDVLRQHVVLVWKYTQVGNAWSSVGAHLVLVPLGEVISPMAYTSLEDNIVLALPPAWM